MDPLTGQNLVVWKRCAVAQEVSIPQLRKDCYSILATVHNLQLLTKCRLNSLKNSISMYTNQQSLDVWRDWTRRTREPSVFIQIEIHSCARSSLWGWQGIKLHRMSLLTRVQQMKEVLIDDGGGLRKVLLTEWSVCQLQGQSAGQSYLPLASTLILKLRYIKDHSTMRGSSCLWESCGRRWLHFLVQGQYWS